MRLRRLMGVADQIVASRFSSIDLSNKASATLNGREFTRTYLTQSDIVNGGTLSFDMGEEPNKAWGSQPEDTPPDFGVGRFLHADGMPK